MFSLLFVVVAVVDEAQKVEVQLDALAIVRAAAGPVAHAAAVVMPAVIKRSFGPVSESNYV